MKQTFLFGNGIRRIGGDYATSKKPKNDEW